MIYECPSCKMGWKDDIEPLNRLTQPLCIFCSSKHTHKELLNWQMEHLQQIDVKHFPSVLRNFYRYTELEIDLLKEKLYEKGDGREISS